MRRTSKDPKEEVSLFVGACRLIVLKKNREVDFALRTVLLTQTMLFTYHTQEDSRLRSRSDPKAKAVELDDLARHEYEYKISKFMRPKLLLQKKDPDIKAYLEELKAPELRLEEGQSINIVAIAIKEESVGKYINGFVFVKPDQAIEFYESVNRALGYQLYCQKLLSSNLPFNQKLSNLIGEVLNGRCEVDPFDFADGKEGEDQITMLGEVLEELDTQTLFNFKDGLMKISLLFKLVDEKSLKYGQQFLSPLALRTEHLSLSGCSLSNYNLGEAIAKVMPNLKSLQKLTLKQNKLSDDMLTTVSNLMRHSKILHQIDLSSNFITFEKEGILNSFLQSLGHYKLSLDVSSNQISNVRTINKYFVNAEGNIPLSCIDIQGNPFKAHHLGMLVKAYLERKQVDPTFTLEMKIGEVQFDDVSAFEVLTREFRQNTPTAMSVPLTLSRHSFRAPEDIHEEGKRSAVVDQLLRRYEAESIAGNFYKRKQIKEELIGLGVEEEVIENQPIQIRIHREQQEEFISRQLEKGINYDTTAGEVLATLNSSIKLARRKGLTGQGVDFLAFVKWRAEQLLEQWEEGKAFGRVVREVFARTENKFTSIYQAAQQGGNYLIGIDYQRLSLSDEATLKGILKAQEFAQKSDLFLVTSFLLSQQPPETRSVLLGCLEDDPRMGCAKVVRNGLLSESKFKEVRRVFRRGDRPDKPLEKIVGTYRIESYRFSQSFLESGVSSSGYQGVLSNGKFQTENLAIVQSFIEIFNNFMQVLYHTPQEISQQGFQYTNAIADYLIDRQNEGGSDLRSTLAEQLFIRMITFFDRQKHQPLQKGLLLAVCQYLMRRIGVSQELGLRVMAYLSKTYSYQFQDMQLHFSSRWEWDGKVDWKVKDLEAVKELVLGRGKMVVAVADISNQKLGMDTEADQLWTIGQLWQDIRQRHLQKICSWGSVDAEEIDCYWLCGTKNSGESWELRYLPSYEHVGKLIFEDLFQRKFFVRRVIFTPQHHSLPYLRTMEYQTLISTFLQVRQSFRESGFVMLREDPNNLRVKLTIEAIWIDVLIEEEVLLGALRGSESKQAKYQEERERIINEHLSKIYIKYLPHGFALSQENRTAVVSELRAKKNEAVPEVMSEAIREKIILFLGKLGVCGYTTKISDARNVSNLYANNKSLVLVDKSANPNKKISIDFKDLIWVQLQGKENAAIKLDFIDRQGEVAERVRMAIDGQVSWLAQCYALLVAICKVRLKYPIQLLFINEDHPLGISEVEFKSQRGAIQQSPLELSEYFQFSISRSQRKQREGRRPSSSSHLSQVKLADSKASQRSRKQINQISPESKKQESQKQESNEADSKGGINKSQVPRPPKPPEQSRAETQIVAIPERSSQSSKRRPSQKSMEIEEIIEEERDREGEVVPARRSSKNSSSRRRSRNR